MKPEQRLARIEAAAGRGSEGCPRCSPAFVHIAWPGEERPTACPNCGRTLPELGPDDARWVIFWPPDSDPQAEWRDGRGRRLDPQPPPPVGVGA